MNKLEVGMYVRTKKGIRKIIKIDEDSNYYIDKTYINDFRQEIDCISDSCIIGEPTFNVRNLLQPRDIVLVDGWPLNDIVRADDYLLDLAILDLYKLQTNQYIKIKYIMTREQFEKESYKLGDD